MAGAWHGSTLGSRVRIAGIGFVFLLAIVALLLTGAERRRRDALIEADPETILADANLAPVAMKLGKPVYAAHCAVCHGSDGKGSGALGVPDLTDGDRLYGTGQVAEIEQVTLHGIRAGDSRGWNLASMPAYATAHPYALEPIAPLRSGEIHDIVNYLTALHGPNRNPDSAARGKALFAGRGNCWDCHAQDASGDAAIGAPSLVDDVWLYGDGSPASLYRSIALGHAGKSPAFAHRLTAVEVRAVSVYVAGFVRSAHTPSKDSE